MLIFVHGPESYLATKKLIDLKESFVKKYPGAQLKVFDFDDDPDLKDISVALDSGESLFSAKSCVVLKNPFVLKKEIQEKLLELLKKAKRSNGDSTVIVSQTSIDPKGKLSNYLKKNSQVFGFELLSQMQAEKWAKSEIEARGKSQVKIDQSALKNLCEITQGNLWQLSNEIDKLIQYCSNCEIGRNDMEKISKGQIETGIFDLVDAMGQKNRARAIELKNNLVMQGDNEFYILSMIHLQFRNMLKVANCLRKGITDPKEISRLCSLHPYVVKKSLSQGRKFGKDELKKIFSLTARIDQMAKKGEVEIGEALDYFIVKV